MKTQSIIGLLAVAALFAWVAPVRADESKLTSRDKTFITNASEGGATEIEASQLALKTTSNADVKSFAQMMVKDHTKAGNELEKIATSKGGEPSKSPGVTQEANIVLLKARSGGSFDKAYASMMLKDHREVVDMFVKASKDLDDADLRAFAEKTLPVLKHHLAMAEKLAGKFGK